MALGLADQLLDPYGRLRQSFPPMGNSPRPPAPAPDSGLPRGLRNNNPLNLVASPWTQSQPGYVGSDGRFARFETTNHGLQAASRLLMNKAENRGLNTVGAIINSWAPPSDNNPTSKYAQAVAAKMGVGVNQRLNLSDTAVRETMMRAMAEFETGRPLPDTAPSRMRGVDQPAGDALSGMVQVASIQDVHTMLDTPVSGLVRQYAPEHTASVPGFIGNQTLRTVLQNPMYGSTVMQSLQPKLAPQLQQWGVTQQDFVNAINQPPPPPAAPVAAPVAAAAPRPPGSVPTGIPGGLNPAAQTYAQNMLKTFPGTPITSGHRSAEHNARVDGASGSQHLGGAAIDISLRGLNDAQKGAIIDHAIANGAKGIGYYPNSDSAHIDFRQGPGAAWGPNYSHTSLNQTPAWFQQRAETLRSGRAPTANALVAQAPTQANAPAQQAITRATQAAPRPQTAQARPPAPAAGRSALAQGIINGYGPAGRDLTTFREPTTGNEIISGSIGGTDFWKNLGPTPGSAPAALKPAPAVAPAPAAPSVPMPRPRPPEAPRDLGQRFRPVIEAPELTHRGVRIGQDENVSSPVRRVEQAPLLPLPREGGPPPPFPPPSGPIPGFKEAPPIAGSPFTSGPVSFPGPTGSVVPRPRTPPPEPGGGLFRGAGLLNPVPAEGFPTSGRPLNERVVGPLGGFNVDPVATPNAVTIGGHGGTLLGAGPGPLATSLGAAPSPPSAPSLPGVSGPGSAFPGPTGSPVPAQAAPAVAPVSQLQWWQRPEYAGLGNLFGGDMGGSLGMPGGFGGFEGGGGFSGGFGVG